MSKLKGKLRGKSSPKPDEKPVHTLAETLDYLDKMEAQYGYVAIVGLDHDGTLAASADDNRHAAALREYYPTKEGKERYQHVVGYNTQNAPTVATYEKDKDTIIASLGKPEHLRSALAGSVMFINTNSEAIHDFSYNNPGQNKPAAIALNDGQKPDQRVFNFSQVGGARSTITAMSDRLKEYIVQNANVEQRYTDPTSTDMIGFNGKQFEAGEEKYRITLDKHVVKQFYKEHKGFILECQADVQNGSTKLKNALVRYLEEKHTRPKIEIDGAHGKMSLEVPPTMVLGSSDDTKGFNCILMMYRTKRYPESLQPVMKFMQGMPRPIVVSCSGMMKGGYYLCPLLLLYKVNVLYLMRV